MFVSLMYTDIPLLIIKENDYSFFRLIDFEKSLSPNPGAQPEIFQGRWGFVKLGHFDKHFIKKSRKKAPQGKILEFFLLDTYKTTFWMANLT